MEGEREQRVLNNGISMSNMCFGQGGPFLGFLGEVFAPVLGAYFALYYLALTWTIYLEMLADGAVLGF